jgi:hypothetical protein
LTVVIAASDSARAVARTLAALAHQRQASSVEVIVAAPRDRLAALLPQSHTEALHDVRWELAAPGTSVPNLRKLGFDKATTPLVAFTEDSCVFPAGWAEAWLAAFDDPRVDAATGLVEPAMGEAAADWAIFFCEYAPFLAAPRRGAKSPTRLAGNNFAVRRRTLAALNLRAVHETEIAAAVAGTTDALATVPGARARHVRRYPLRDAIGDRLRFGHDYGRLRARRWPWALRLAGLCAGPLILGIQAVRLTAILIARRRHLGRFLDTLPLTAGLLSAWSVGEWLGWLSTLVRPPAADRQRAAAVRTAASALARARRRPARCTAAPPAA